MANLIVKFKRIVKENEIPCHSFYFSREGYLGVENGFPFLRNQALNFAENKKLGHM